MVKNYVEILKQAKIVIESVVANQEELEEKTKALEEVNTLLSLLYGYMLKNEIPFKESEEIDTNASMILVSQFNTSGYLQRVDLLFSDIMCFCQVVLDECTALDEK